MIFGTRSTDFGGGTLGAEEGTELLALFLGVWWVPADIGWVALEEIGHKHLVVVLAVRVGDDVSSLKGLREESEDIVDEEDSGSSG